MSLEKIQTNDLLLKHIGQLSQALLDKDECILKMKSESEKQKKRHQKKINKLEETKRYRYFLGMIDSDDEFTVLQGFYSQTSAIDFVKRELCSGGDGEAVLCSLFDGKHTFSNEKGKYFLMKVPFVIRETFKEGKDDPRLTEARKGLLLKTEAKGRQHSVVKPSKSKSEEENSSEVAVKPKRKRAYPKKGMKHSSSDEESLKKYKRFTSVVKGSGHAKPSLPEYSTIFNGNVIDINRAKNADEVAKLSCIKIVKSGIEHSNAIKFTVVNEKSDHHTFWKAWGSPGNYHLKMIDELSSLSSSEKEPKRAPLEPSESSSSESSVPKPRAKAKGKAKAHPTKLFKIKYGDSQTLIYAAKEMEAVRMAAHMVMKTKLDKIDMKFKVEKDAGSGSIWHAQSANGKTGALNIYKIEDYDEKPDYE